MNARFSLSLGQPQPRNARQFEAAGSRQRGAALFIALVFLVMLTMLGLTAMQVSTMEERMAGNLRDRSLAMQAAEAGLRYAERDVVLMMTRDRRNPYPAYLAVSSTGCDATGICFQERNAPSISDYEHYRTIWETNAREYGKVPGPAATPIPRVARQPRYLIEPFSREFPFQGERTLFRITVRATGANPNTVVMLQEVLMP